MIPGSPSGPGIFLNQAAPGRSVGQLLLNHPPTKPLPAAGIARVVRQICLLREQGDAAQAARLQENDLADAVRDLRLAHGPAVLPEAELQAMFAAEEQRVAEAVILSELLIPRLVESWPVHSGPVRSAASRPGRESPSVAAPAPAAGPPAIPDLLDAMLAAERPGRRPSPATHRES